MVWNCGCCEGCLTVCFFSDARRWIRLLLTEKHSKRCNGPLVSLKCSRPSTPLTPAECQPAVKSPTGVLAEVFQHCFAARLDVQPLVNVPDVIPGRVESDAELIADFLD